jgi:hypothetical protein
MAGRSRTIIAAKNASPRIATGTPTKVDWGLVVTRSQLIVPLELQAMNFGDVTCATVRYVETASRRSTRRA